MDQDAFRRTYREVNERSCWFEKAILTNQCRCSQAERFCIAEREGVQCQSEDGHALCKQLLDLLREQARFALRTDNDSRRTLPHGKAIRIQVGGMRGIAAALRDDESATEVDDIFALLNGALDRYGTLQALPFSRIMQHIAAYKGRPRLRRK